MTQSKAEIAMGILDSVEPHTLNAIVCDLIRAGKIEQLGAIHGLKGDLGFVKPEGIIGHRFSDVFDEAVRAMQVDVVRELLSFGLEPVAKLSVHGIQKDGEHAVTALDHAVDNVIRAETDEERERAVVLALVIYDAVKDKFPPLGSVHLRYPGSDGRNGNTPAKALGERTDKIGNEREAPKRVKYESLLDHCISNQIGPLKEAIISYVESFPTLCFSSRSVELLVATRDMQNFERLMAYTGEVDCFLMDQILKLPHDLQEVATSVIAEHEIDPGIISKLGDYAGTMAPATMLFLFSKCSIEVGADTASVLLVKALAKDNIPLAKEVIAIGEARADWSVNNSAMETVNYTYGGQKTYLRYPIHECRSGDAVRLLAQHGADIEQHDSEGRTPLQAMVSQGAVDRSGDGRDDRGPGLLSALLEAGADITTRYQGRTLTQLAAPRSSEVKAILRAGKTQVLLADTLNGVDGEAAAPRSRGPAPM